MDMNKTFFLHKEDRRPQWRLIDAKGAILGRLACQIANALRGKDKPYFTPHEDAGDYVIVINAEKVALTGDKWEGKEYARYTGWIGGYRVTKAKDMLIKHPTQLIELAVFGMLPKNKLNRQIIKKLKVYVGDQHPHTAQLETSNRLDYNKAQPIVQKKSKRSSKNEAADSKEVSPKKTVVKKVATKATSKKTAVKTRSKKAS
jgi:large subunit ribosomal protein L13